MANININGDLQAQNVRIQQSIISTTNQLNISATNGVFINGSDILARLTLLENNKANLSDLIVGQNSNGYYALFPNGLLFCWGSVVASTAGTYDVPLPYFPISTDYSVGWSMNSSTDTSQSFRGMGAWNKQTTQFSTRRFSSNSKDWLLVGKWKQEEI